MVFFKLVLLLGLLSLTSAQIIETLQTNYTTAYYAEQFGYRVEDVKVTTSDGYILTIHHLVNPNQTENLTGRPVAFLMHGIICSSSIYNLWSKSLGYYLIEQGYDVYMGNARGNQYSLEHTTLLPDSPAFYAFSWDQIALIDVPTMIDRVLEVTGQSKVTYVGHSQGTTVFFALAAAMPEYTTEKIISGHMLAPVGFLEHVNGTLADTAELALGGPNPLAATTGAPLLPNTLLNGICGLVPSCIALINVIFGPSENYESTVIPDILRTIPAGSSINQLQQYSQLIRDFGFHKFDFGSVVNTEQYGTATPTDYDLSQIQTPMFFYYAAGDYLSPTDDVNRLLSIVPPSVVAGLHFYEEWHHLDYLFGAEIDTILNPVILQNIQSLN